MAGAGRAGVLLLVGALCACAGPPPKSDVPARKPGGYYLDDGPPDATPARLEAIPDAQPRPEPIKSSTTRPYTALGRRFVPMASLQPYTATGIASWYGRRYHGRPTASGEPYDMFSMSAAHPLLPIPSYARVTHLDTQRSVVVRINDRGPFLAERLIDLSYAAAYKLGIVAHGQGRVRVDAIVPADTAALPAVASAPVASPVPSATLASRAVWLQLGAFADAANAQALLRRARSAMPMLAPLTAIQEQEGMYRVRTGPFASRAEALQAAAEVSAGLAIEPALVAP
ncbi:MAG: septal ring lytic transglycosylase RlpA family protein [Burkholderiales bacterium]|nr:septal ring lytic transglycosylase RlpA family protein [Burkholderiales bacterium]